MVAFDCGRKSVIESKGCGAGSLGGPDSDGMYSTQGEQETDVFYLLPFATPPISRDFTIMDKELGRGQFGVVRPCVHHRNGLVYACKTICKRNLRTVQQIKCVETELSVAINLARNPNIVQFVALYEDGMDIHCVMELCTGGDLFDTMTRVHKFDESHAADLFGKITDAVQFCHSNGIVHRDLKPENILLSVSEKGAVVRPKLADFGLSVHLKEGESAFGLTGSPYYVAPEVIEGKAYDFTIDIWSLGVLLHAMLAGFLPFWGNTSEEIFQKIQFSEINFNTAAWSTVSEPAKNLVRRMLSRDPKLRPTASEILSDPWVISKGKCSIKSPATAAAAAAAASASVPESTRLSNSTTKLSKPARKSSNKHKAVSLKKAAHVPPSNAKNKIQNSVEASHPSELLDASKLSHHSNVASSCHHPSMDVSCHFSKVDNCWNKFCGQAVHLFA